MTMWRDRAGSALAAKPKNFDCVEMKRKAQGLPE